MFSLESGGPGEKACSRTCAKGGRTNFLDETEAALPGDATGAEADALVTRLPALSFFACFPLFNVAVGFGDRAFRTLARVIRFVGFELVEPIEKPGDGGWCACLDRETCLNIFGERGTSFADDSKAVAPWVTVVVATPFFLVGAVLLGRFMGSCLDTAGDGLFLGLVSVLGDSGGLLLALVLRAEVASVLAFVFVRFGRTSLFFCESSLSVLPEDSNRRFFRSVFTVLKCMNSLRWSIQESI